MAAKEVRFSGEARERLLRGGLIFDQLAYDGLVALRDRKNPRCAGMRITPARPANTLSTSATPPGPESAASTARLTRSGS